VSPDAYISQGYVLCTYVAEHVFHVDRPCVAAFSLLCEYISDCSWLHKEQFLVVCSHDVDKRMHILAVMSVLLSECFKSRIVEWILMKFGVNMLKLRCLM
jgi:hypothetical protein